MFTKVRIDLQTELNEIKEEYLYELKTLVISETTDKISTIMEANNTNLLNKTIDVIRNVIPNINAKQYDDINRSLYSFQKTISSDTQNLLKSLETPPNVIEHIISQKGFETSWKRQMGHLSPEQMVLDLKQKGYPNEIIEKMMKKMGVQKSALNATVKLTDDEIADMLKNLGGSFDRESVKKALTEFSKQRGLKLNSKQIEQVADDVVIELGKMNPKFRPEEFERIWTTKMTTKDKENLIKKVFVSKDWSIQWNKIEHSN